MSQFVLDEVIQAGVTEYVAKIAVPPYRRDAVESRCPPMSVEPNSWLRAWAAIPAYVLLVMIALIAFTPAVVAQVQRIMQAFETVDGRTRQVPIGEASLEQARADMPFTVIAPAGIPANFHENIQEINRGSSDALVMFQFIKSGNTPPITIIESSARGTGSSSSLFLGYRAPHPTAAHGHFFKVNLTPLTWTTSGTRIQLLTPPGALSQQQIAAIVRAMH